MVSGSGCGGHADRKGRVYRRILPTPFTPPENGLASPEPPAPHPTPEDFFSAALLGRCGLGTCGSSDFPSTRCPRTIQCLLPRQQLRGPSAACLPQEVREGLASRTQGSPWENGGGGLRQLLCRAGREGEEEKAGLQACAADLEGAGGASSAAPCRGSLFPPPSKGLVRRPPPLGLSFPASLMPQRP